LDLDEAPYPSPLRPAGAPAHTSRIAAAAPTSPTTTADLLAGLRRARGFDAEEVLASKLGLLNRFFETSRLDAAVVGVSGGVDSAVVLGLLERARRAAGSPLQRVVALLLPVDRPGATGQADATARGTAAADALGSERWLCPLGEAFEQSVVALEGGAGEQLEAWTAGQLLSVQRTPLLYGAAALLQQEGHRSLVVGTTNRDEGAYLGFFGKASDGMVDLQPISDLHKSEVYGLAALLGVPESIRGAAPRGDVHDGRTDAEMIGATYDEVELVLRLLEVGRDPRVVAASLDDRARLMAAADAVERLHAHNAHKYAVGDPAHHLDVLPRAVPGGWRRRRPDPPDPSPPTDIPGAWSPPTIELDEPRAEVPVAAVDHGVLVAPGVLTGHDCDRLVHLMDATAEPAPVGVTGRQEDPDLDVGSVRATAWSPGLAAQLWRRLAPVVPAVRFLGPLDATDGWGRAAPGTVDRPNPKPDDPAHRTGHRTWQVVGLSPLLRFMEYPVGGHHLCHHDAGYDYGDGRRTLMSVVFYLTGAGDGGATRLLRDGQDQLPVWRRDHDDWDRETEPDDVVRAFAPTLGGAVVFDHRLPHDVELWRGPGRRVIVRADVVYRAVEDGRALP
jgi:NAD+ synthetase